MRSDVVVSEMAAALSGGQAGPNDVPFRFLPWDEEELESVRKPILELLSGHLFAKNLKALSWCGSFQSETSPKLKAACRI
jgi:hypothetical protein